MSVLAVNTESAEGGDFITRWKWKTNPNSRPIQGSIKIKVDACHTSDRAALAEIHALHYLLESREIHGENRLGTDIRVCLSSSTVRKALLKGSLKVQGTGKAESANVGAAATFLATKYFEATYEVQRWKEEEPKAVEPEVQCSVGSLFPRVELHCALLNRPVQVTRHAMHRWVGRISEGLDRYTENDLSKLPDARWTKAWRTLAGVLSHKGLLRADLLPEVANRYQQRYGKSCIYLHFSDAMAVFVLVDGAQGLDLVTVIKTNPHMPILSQQRYMVGQQIKTSRGTIDTP